MFPFIKHFGRFGQEKIPKSIWLTQLSFIQHKNKFIFILNLPKCLIKGKNWNQRGNLLEIISYRYIVGTVAGFVTVEKNRYTK